ncbi:MAG: hypothetical protein Q8R92_19640 [Deltaproteobacteria bacterium]|nr:hypothetical protein [Deltaproteobacteria bacterium]
MARTQSRREKPGANQTLRGAADRAAYPELQELPLTMTAPAHPSSGGPEHAPPLPASAASGVFVLDISENLEVTGKFICKVPVGNDVLHCGCGGVLSQRFNESLFCRTCGKEGSH